MSELQAAHDKSMPAAANEKGGRSAQSKPAESRTAVDKDLVIPPGATAPAEVEKVFAMYSLPGRGEKYASRASMTAGYGAGWRINAISIRRIETYLAVAAVLVLAVSLLTYWIGNLETESEDPELSVQYAADEPQPEIEPQPGIEPRPGIESQPIAAENNPAANPEGGTQWQSAAQTSSGDRSLNRGTRAPAPEISQPNSAASEPQPIAASAPNELGQLNTQKPAPTRKREKAEKKKVTVDDLITDKKKVTVDDLINDN